MNDSRPVGSTDDGQQIIEVDSTNGLYENHSSVIDGQAVPDAGYDPDADKPTPEPSPEQQMIAALYARVTKLEDGGKNE
ncbi:hypothetical protein LCAUCD174_0885 [Lacticaseibacillus paracasei]|nr:hypothetical protein LCAUCD174_0885 [Lacticaseibacillus paracasei]